MHTATLLSFLLVGGANAASRAELLRSIQQCGGIERVNGYFVTPAALTSLSKISVSQQLQQVVRIIEKGSQTNMRRSSRMKSSSVTHVFNSISTISASLTDETIDDLLNDPAVGRLTADCIISIDPSETIPSPLTVQTGAPWGVDRINTRDFVLDGEYDDADATGDQSIVYILDTGVRISHQDFQNRALPGWSYGCRTGNEDACGSTSAGGWVHQGVINSATSQCHPHGTHCASTAAGATYGVAKEATIIAVQVLDCDGFGSGTSVLAGIEWAMQDAETRNKKAIISMSLGGGFSQETNNMIKDAFEKDILTVVSAGNDGSDACSKSPASAPFAVTVGSTERRTSSGSNVYDHDGKSGFSNYGTCVDIQAPGTAIPAAVASSDFATAIFSGTSMACPHVAGVSAQIRTLYPSMTTQEVAVALECLSTKNIIDGIDTLDILTPNKLLFNAFHLDTNCLGIRPPSLPSPPSPPPPPPSYKLKVEVRGDFSHSTEYVSISVSGGGGTQQKEIVPQCGATGFGDCDSAYRECVTTTDSYDNDIRAAIASSATSSSLTLHFAATQAVNWCSVTVDVRVTLTTLYGTEMVATETTTATAATFTITFAGLSLSTSPLPPSSPPSPPSAPQSLCRSLGGLLF